MTPPRSFRRTLLALSLAANTACATAQQPQRVHDPTLRASAPRPPEVPSPVAVPLDAAARSRLPRERVRAEVNDEALQCEGVSLAELLRRNERAMPQRLHGPHLARYVLATARDGRRALFSLAELDPATGSTRAYVVDRCGGAPLDRATGPLRLLVPSGGNAARNVRQLLAVAVIVAP
ncbi:hypothetical protein [Luteimonas sp. R10]|uniref:hypothetical protein n=1 Tax=Luteimonas sp. R10 TaxID=3108176 RepID=UPI00308BEC63|nr:hypothetical protein U3649_17285 [Luteimonas sp. R10]